MSTLKVTTITDTSGGNTTTINSMTPTADSLQGFRNRIINGDMRIDQRNAGAAVTPATFAFPVDRWRAEEDTDGAYTIEQVEDAPSGFVQSIKVTVTTADASIGANQTATIQQRIEGNNVADFGLGTASAKTFTLSFWVKSSLTGTFGGGFSNAAENRSYAFTYAINAANTWEYKTITVAGDTTGTWQTGTSIGLRVNFGLAAGSTYAQTAGSWSADAKYFSATGAVNVMGTLNATWQVTGVQLEVGSTATPFERRPYGTELMLCQRYLPAYLGSALAVQYQGQAYSTTAAYIPIPHPVVTRVAPTGITTSSMSAVITKSDGSGATITNLAFTQAGVSSTVVNATGASGLTAGNASILIFNSGTLLLTGCEL
jgi:hypothetical protein